MTSAAHRCSPAQGQGPEDERQDVLRRRRHVEREPAVDEIQARHAIERIVGVRERKEGRGDLERPRHVRARHDQAAEQQLRKDERGHELDRLELRPRERAQEEAQRHPEHRVPDASTITSQLGPAVSRPSRPKATPETTCLDRGDERESGAVAEQQVELRERQGHQRSSVPVVRSRTS